MGTDHLARWTIVSLRWPRLADLLRKDPNAIDYIGLPVSGDVPEDVRTLFTDKEVLEVTKGVNNGHGRALDPDAIRAAAGLSLYVKHE